MTWLLAFAGFAALIILHEFGHFVAAKLTGMRVERFFLFFPPRIWSVKRGETEYGIGAIPLGGFVKITGMNPDDLEPRRDEDDEEGETPNDLLTRIEGAGQSEQDDRLPDGRLKPEVAARAYYNQSVWKRIVVIAAGPAMNLLIAFVILFALAFGVKEATALAVGEIEDGSPAAGALREGDRIVSIDGIPATQGGERPSADELAERAETLADQINTGTCAGEQTDGCAATTPAALVVERGGERVPVEATPVYDADAPAIEGEGTGRFRLGFRFDPVDEVPLNPSVGEAATRSLDFMWFVTSETVSTLAQLFRPEKREEVSGIVGGYETTRQAISLDAETALTVIALISLSLAIINLFPFLPLDGGHIFWSVVEKVRGRRVAFETMERSGAIGFVLILFLFFIGLSNDIDRLTGEGFGLDDR
ncbi:MAG: M50 family metallopeptidase [Solirubrobacterales bacterium]